MKCLMPALLAMFAVTALADSPLRPEDFAYGVYVQPAGSASIYRVEVPEIVYSAVTAAGIGDMRVFNASHEPVPFSLRLPAPVQAPEPEPVAPPFFPYETVQRGKPGANVSVRVTSNGAGTVVSVDDGKPLQNDEYVSAYLVDISTLEFAPVELVVAWSSPQERFVTRMRVDGSDDLVSWSALHAGAPLVKLSYEGHALEQNSVRLPGRKYRYLRLAWPAGDAGAKLTGVQVRGERSTQPVQRRWLELHGRRGDGSDSVSTYDTEGHFPVDRVDIQPVHDNSLIDAAIASRPAADSPWRNGRSGTFYRLAVDGAVLTSDPVVVNATGDRYWQVTARSESGDPPVLRLGYVPHQLYFLAQGEGPYLIAFGALGVSDQHASVDQLLRRVESDVPDNVIVDVQPGERVTLGGEQRLSLPPPPFPWKSVILWLVLICGVLVLTWMAWRLGRQVSGS